MFPGEIATLRQEPDQSQAESVMYRQVVADLARKQGWSVHLFDAKTVEAEALQVLGDRVDEALHGPRRTLGPPWTKGHRMALAATVVAG